LSVRPILQPFRIGQALGELGKADDVAIIRNWKW
jgi:hypothetical protein